MNILQISDKHFLGAGRQKSVYLHPNDKGKCIKFPKENQEKSLQREIKYIERHHGNIPFVSSYRGNISTNLGEGAIFDLICDANGKPSKSLQECREQNMSLANLEEKVEFIFNELVRNKAALSELESCNILVKLKNDRAYDLDIIDGFGNSDFLKICDVSRFFLKRKLVRKFAKFCDQLQLSRVF